MRTDTTAHGLFVGKPSQILVKGYWPLTAVDALAIKVQYRRFYQKVNNIFSNTQWKNRTFPVKNRACQPDSISACRLLPRRFALVSLANITHSADGRLPHTWPSPPKRRAMASGGVFGPNPTMQTLARQALTTPVTKVRTPPGRYGGVPYCLRGTSLPNANDASSTIACRSAPIRTMAVVRIKPRRDAWAAVCRPKIAWLSIFCWNRGTLIPAFDKGQLATPLAYPLERQIGFATLSLLRCSELVGGLTRPARPALSPTRRMQRTRQTGTAMRAATGRPARRRDDLRSPSHSTRRCAFHSSMRVGK